MVSTRSVKNSKFSEGEKVLCYEPDPAKTKVLYNSKVLGVGLRKDENGRNVAHFLIHFQGWNSTWDRFVTEDYILKDTEENRKLQKELAEKAQLTASHSRGGNLYRRGRKKRTLSRTGSDNERRGGGESDSESEIENKPTSSFSPGLQAILETDNLMILKQKKLLKLPASPNAVQILELYMKEFTISQIRLMCHRRGHLRPIAGKNAHITVSDITSRANLCREIADGLRVYLDFMTEPALLYGPERAQFKEFVTTPRNFHPSDVLSTRREDGKEANGSRDDHFSKRCSPLRESDRRKSLRSHSESSSNPPPQQASVSSTSTSMSCSNNANPPETKQNCTVMPNKTVEAPSLSEQIDLASFLGQDVVKGGEHLLLRPISQRERDVLKRLVHRKLVPESFYVQDGPDVHNPPCLIYGATHLARALVKIPEIYPHSEHPESKMNIIQEYLNGFTKFLEEHSDWFGEEHYCDNTYTDHPADSASHSQSAVSTRQKDSH